PTPALANILRHHNPCVEVIPDLAEAGHWTGPAPAERFGDITVGLRGGSTHGPDWAPLEPIWRKLAERYPNVCFVSLGLEVDWMRKLPAERYHHLKWSLIDEYQRNLGWVDIGCAPMAEIAFNRSKSPIAFYDFSLAGAATVASPLIY